MIFENLYDSHVHLLATGEVAEGLNLRGLKSYDDYKRINLRSEFFRGEWLVGFGWDENFFTDLEFDRRELDRLFPEYPVFFSRVDGHASWLNSLGLERLGILQSNGSGVLKGSDHIRALASLPQFSREQKKSFLYAAQRIFNSNGFTHIRDMGSTREQFEITRDMENRESLSLQILHNFICENLGDFSKALSEAQYCQRSSSRLLKVGGLKFFVDGSLGSETAYLSRPYSFSGQRGVFSWELKDLEFVIRQTWLENLEVSVHTIGDEAADQVIKLARKIYSSGVSGILNLEHVEVLRPETIQAMKSLHVVCHMQPSHWLSDQPWLEDKLGDLFRWAFPWESLRLAKVQLQFGSDSPIEPPDLFRTIEAIEKSPAKGIKRFLADPLHFHISIKNRLLETYTEIEGSKIKRVIFEGRQIT